MLRMRQRTFLVFIMAVVVLVLSALSDPDGWVKTAAWLIDLSKAVVLITFAHWFRKAYLDYGPDTDMRSLFKASSPGHALIAIAVFFLAFVLAGSARAQDVRTHIPPQAHQFLPTLQVEVQQHFAHVPHRGYHGALIEYESGCFALKRKCWNPRSELKSAREQGAGLGQITRAYRTDGSQRFDALAEMVDRFPQLRGWTWANVFDRPDMQMRAVVLMTRADFDHFARFMRGKFPGWEAEALRFADAAYNGGRGGVDKDRRACHLKPGCDPFRWTGNVEHLCMKSREPIYGKRSACDINRHHVVDVFLRADKYLRVLT